MGNGEQWRIHMQIWKFMGVWMLTWMNRNYMGVLGLRCDDREGGRYSYKSKGKGEWVVLAVCACVAVIYINVRVVQGVGSVGVKTVMILFLVTHQQVLHKVYFGEAPQIRRLFLVYMSEHTYPRSIASSRSWHFSSWLYESLWSRLSWVVVVDCKQVWADVFWTVEAFLLVLKSGRCVYM